MWSKTITKYKEPPAVWTPNNYNGSTYKYLNKSDIQTTEDLLEWLKDQPKEGAFLKFRNHPHIYGPSSINVVLKIDKRIEECAISYNCFPEAHHLIQLGTFMGTIPNYSPTVRRLDVRDWTPCTEQEIKDVVDDKLQNYLKDYTKDKFPEAYKALTGQS